MKPYLDRGAFYLTCGALVSILFSIAASQILMGLALAALLFSSTPLRLPPIKLPLALFLIGTVISLLASGHIQQGMPQIRGGKLRTIAVSSPERLALLPDVPTIKEAGFPGVEAVVWWCFLVPAKTPADVIAKLNKDLESALRDEKVKATLAEMGAVVKGGSPNDFKNWIASETVKWTKIIKTANIKGE